MFEERVRQAIFDSLEGMVVIYDDPIPVYDDVPQPMDGGADSAFPYIVIGDNTFAPWDTDTESGAEVTVTIHSWSRYSGRQEINRIHDAVYEILHRTFPAVAFMQTVGCDLDGSDSFLESDGETRHGVQRFRLVIDEADIPDVFATEFAVFFG